MIKSNQYQKKKCIKRTLTKSSIISLTAETKRIKHSGTNVVNRPVGDTSGICCNESKNKH